MTPAELIAANLQALPHPDGTARALPGFNAQLLPEEMHKQIADTAKELGEAIVYLLESSGYQLTTEPPPPAEAPDTAAIHCTLCDTRLFTLNLVNPTHCLTNGPLFLAAIHNLTADCPHQ